MGKRSTAVPGKFLWFVLGAAIGFGNVLPGQNPGPERKETEVTPIQRKIAPLIRSTSARLSARRIDRTNAATSIVAEQFSGPLIKVDNKGRIQLYLDLTELNADRMAALTATAEMEIEITNERLKRVQAWVPYEKIEALAALDFVVRIRLPDYAVTRAGSKNTEGDTILKANQVRSTLGITGAGVKVGVISDGANAAAAAQARGDLPPSIMVFGSCIPEPPLKTCNEGTAMMEIIYDLAPGVTLAMADVNTDMEFMQRVTDLANWGAKVIVDDVGYPAQPYFEDGDVAAAYTSALAQGIVVVSAAGNDAEVHYQGTFVASGSFHNFGGGDITMHFTTNHGPAAVIMQWSNPFGHSADNYDLCLTNAAGTTVLFCSDEPQTGTQDPVEVLQFMCNSGLGCIGDIRITKVSGANQTLELFFLGAFPTEFVVPSDSIFGHAAVPGVISVGAISASNTGNITIESYSSRGPSTVFFPSLQHRPTPTITTIDCVSVTGSGGFPSPFCGTSAAAPHAAAVVALLLQANPALTSNQILFALQNTAVERGTSGYDNTYGAGLVEALSAVYSVIQVQKRHGQITSN